tara:strand:+ start:404 stop:625 length:222 start_codon:yes stop_codon:yes gene_type:complete
MVRRTLADHVVEILRYDEWVEASILRDRLHDRMKGGTPSIRELTSHLGRNKNVISKNAPAGKTQIKTYSLKKI